MLVLHQSGLTHIKSNRDFKGTKYIRGASGAPLAGPREST
jgi:hypothetical protein